MLKAYKYRIYPNLEQQEYLVKTFGCTRFIYNKMLADKIVRFKFKRNGIGTPGHLRIPEAEEMAEELTKFIESFGEEIWN